MTDTPSSRGSGALVRKPSNKMDEFDVLKRRLQEKEREVESLNKTVDSYKSQTVQQEQESTDLKTQLQELRKQLEEVHLPPESLPRNRKNNIPVTHPVSLVQDTLPFSESSEEESSGSMRGIQKLVAEKDLDENHEMHRRPLDWSFSDVEQLEMSDKELRTSLLERILEMAGNSDSFRIQLIENVEILLRSKELSITDPEAKISLQNSITKVRDKRHSMKQSLESGFDDLDERVNACFAGLAEFEAFRKFFDDELGEIKRLNDLTLSDDLSQFSPLVTSSPAKNVHHPKSALRKSCSFSRNRNSARAAVRFDDNGSGLLSGSAHCDSPQLDCKDCARYRALLRSFRTTQEADRQKQQEQIRTIEKLSSVITNSKRIPRRQSLTLSSLYQSANKFRSKMDEPDRCEVDLASRRLNFDGSPSFTSHFEPDRRDRSDCGDFPKEKRFVGVPDLIDEFRSMETVSDTVIEESKEFGEQTDLETATEKDLKVEITMLKNKISALEFSLLNAQESVTEHQTNLSDSGFAEKDRTSEMTEVVCSLNKANRELQRLRDENQELLHAGRTMNSTCEEMQEQLEKLRFMESVNTTGDMSLTHPSTPSASDVGIPYNILLEEFRKLENDFAEMARTADCLLNEKTALQHENQSVHQERFRLAQELNRLKATQVQNPDIVEQHNEKVVKLERQLEVTERNRRQLQEQVDKLLAERNHISKISQDQTIHLREQALKDIAQLQALRSEFEEERNDLRSEIQSEHSIVVHLQSELERLETVLQSVRREKEDLEDSVRREKQRRESSRSPRRDTNNVLEREFFVLQEKYDLLEQDYKAAREAGIELGRENVYLRKNLENEKVTKREHDAALNESQLLRRDLENKERQLKEYLAEIEEQRTLLREAQSSFDKENKGVFSKFLAPFKKPHAAQPKRLPRRSHTMTPTDDFGEKTPVRERNQTKQKTLTFQTTKSHKSTAIDNTKAGTLPVKSSIVHKTEVAHYHTKPNVTLPSTATLVKPTKQSPKQDLVIKASTSKTVVTRPISAVSVREPFVAPEHPHSLKIFMNFRAQKCNICLGNIPYFSHAEKCTDCRHVYHTRCSKQVREPACNAAVALDEEERKGRPSLQSTDLDETEHVPLVEGYLLVKKKGMTELSKLYVELVKERLSIYEKKPASHQEYVHVLERLDLNEDRRQAEIICHRTVSTSELDLPLYDLPFCFAIEIKFANSAVEPTKYYFKARNIIEKYNWTASIEDILTSNEADTVDALSKYFSSKMFLAYQMDLLVSCCLFYDNARLLIGTDKGLFVLDCGSGTNEGLVPVSGYEGLPVYQLAIHDVTKEVLMIAGENQTMYRGDLYTLLKWSSMESPSLLKQLFSSDSSGCHLIESFENYIAVAQNGRIMVYEYKNRNSCRLLIAIRTADILDRGQPVMDADHPARSLKFIKPRFSKLQLVIGLNEFWCCDVIDTKRDVPGLPTRKGQNGIVIKQLLRPPTGKNMEDYYWTSEGRVLEDLDYGTNTRHTMGFFPMPVASEHQKKSAQDRIYLLCFYDGWVFVNGNGVPTGSEHIGWKRVPRLIYHEYPYVYILHFNSIQVRRIIKTNTEYSLSPPFFYQLEDPWVVGDLRSHSVIVTSKNARNSRMHIQQLDVEITEDDVEQRRRMPADDNDTASTSSLAFTEPL